MQFEIRMPKPIIFFLLAGSLVLNLAGCGEVARLPEVAGTGPHPTLPPPHQTLIPTGALLVADDVGNVVWRVKPAASTRQ